MSEPILTVDDLHIGFIDGKRRTEVVHGISFALARGDRLGIVGESGSGKSLTALAVMRLLGRHGLITRGTVRLGDLDLTRLASGPMRRVRGRRIAMVFQDPMAALNPAISVGRQLVDVILSHEPVGTSAARMRALSLLDQVGIADAAERARLYPFQLSGGMRQRVMIALAIACRPEILIADEPTTALDVTVQAQVIALIRELCDTLGLALVFISHNLDLVAELCDRILVLKDGAVVEQGSAEAIFAHPAHPYTRKLLDSVLRLPTTEYAE